MKGYYKRDRQIVMDVASSNDLPQNALEWAAVFRKDDPKFSYRFVKT